MAEWVAVALTTVVAIAGFAVLWGAMEERMREQAVRLGKVEASTQSPEERKALALVVESALQSHETEDTLKFTALDKRVTSLEKAIESKLDTILGILTRSV